VLFRSTELDALEPDVLKSKIFEAVVEKLDRGVIERKQEEDSLAIQKAREKLNKL